MHCSSCGATLPPVSDFCPYCGTQVGDVEAADSTTSADPEPWRAPHDRDRADASLGSPVEDASFDPDPPSKPRWRWRKKKKPRSSLKQPPRPRLPLWQSIPIWLAALVLVGLIGWGGFHLWQTRDAVRTVSGHLNAVMQQNWVAAYGFTAAAFRRQTPQRDFTIFARSTRSLAYLAFYAVEDRDMEDDRGTVKFRLIDRAGSHTPAAFDLVKEEGEWRIYAIRLGTGAETDAQPIPVSERDADVELEKATDPNGNPPARKETGTSGQARKPGAGGN